MWNGAVGAGRKVRQKGKAVALPLLGLARAVWEHHVWRSRKLARSEPIATERPARTLESGRTFSVLVWNIQYCAGRATRFFYDGGEGVHVPLERTLQTLTAVARAIRDLDADIVMLQEVDRDSDRTSRIDQHVELLQRLAYPCHTSTSYYENRYVPYPPWHHLGRVDMHLSVFSRFALVRAHRHPLPALREGFLRRQFNLRRAVLEVELPTSKGGRLRVLNTHLDAFSRGDGTLPRQLAAVVERLRAGEPAIVGGDFNALPPGDDPARLGPDAELYRDDGWPLQVLFDGWQSAVPLEAHTDEPERWRTWLPFGSEVAERAIDHLFASRGVEILDCTVASGLHELSDHLPLKVEMRLVS
jgi:endonuclease/exonuclease/phosphatase family metal-dependent hydrolase